MGPFQNDDALDWTGDWEDAEDLSPARLALIEAALADDYFEAPDGARAVAAAEVVAAAMGDASALSTLPDSLAEWVGSHPDAAHDDDVRAAIVAIDRVLADNSELSELWQSDPSWAEGITGLRRRLAAVIP